MRPYLSSYWPNFDQTLKVGFWDPLEQIPTVMTTFAKATFVLATSVHISNISMLTILYKKFLNKLFCIFVHRIFGSKIFLDTTGQKKICHIF